MKRTVAFVLVGGAIGLLMVRRRQRAGVAPGCATVSGSSDISPATLALLRIPDTGEPLERSAPPASGGIHVLAGAISGRRVPIRAGIPDFLDPATLVGSNATWQRRYDRFAPFYDLSTRLYARLRSGGDEARVREYLAELEIKPGDRVLEVSVGTGRNLHYLPANAHYVGLDLSAGMLRVCQANLCRWHREADLVLGSAERLPFCDAAFDVVFHVGGINFFSDPPGAVAEMVRVAKPGTKILVVDETEKVAGAYRRLPARGGAATARSSVVPRDFVPPGMLDVRVTDVAHGELYCLTFRTPPSPAA
jgi:ubiquinone/menaquinone biosynthesis C-methylase UbiE